MKAGGGFLDYLNPISGIAGLASNVIGAFKGGPKGPVGSGLPAPEVNPIAPPQPMNNPFQDRKREMRESAAMKMLGGQNAI